MTAVAKAKQAVRRYESDWGRGITYYRVEIDGKKIGEIVSHDYKTREWTARLLADGDHYHMIDLRPDPANTSSLHFRSLEKATKLIEKLHTNAAARDRYFSAVAHANSVKTVDLLRSWVGTAKNMAKRVEWHSDVHEEACKAFVAVVAVELEALEQRVKAELARLNAAAPVKAKSSSAEDA